jgi:hypothetical protein
MNNTPKKIFHAILELDTIVDLELSFQILSTLLLVSNEAQENRTEIFLAFAKLLIEIIILSRQKNVVLVLV